MAEVAKFKDIIINKKAQNRFALSFKFNEPKLMD